MASRVFVRAPLVEALARLSRLALAGADATAAGFFVCDESRGARWVAHVGNLGAPAAEVALSDLCFEVLRDGKPQEVTDSEGRRQAARPVCHTQDGCAVAAFIRADRSSFSAEQLRCLEDIAVSASEELRLLLATSQLAALLDHINAGVLFEGGDRRGQLVNREFCALFGTLPADAVGLFGGGLLAKARGFFESPSDFVRSTNRAIRVGKTERGERFATRDGRWLERSYVPVSLPHGNNGHLWTFRDVTHELEAEAGLRERNGWLKLLLAITEVTNSTTDEQATLDRAVQLICERAGWIDGRVAIPSDPLPLVQKTAEAARACWEHSRQRLGKSARILMTRTHLACPIVVGRKVERVLVFELAGHVTPQGATLEALAIAANTLGQSLARLRREQVIKEQSLIDPLTALYNRRGFMLLGEQQLRLAARQGAPLVVFFMDLNGLKAINDEQGHEVGDLAICDAAKVLKASFRSTDIVARLAGDEYCVLSVDLKGSDIPHVLGRLSSQLESFNHLEQRPYKLSMSVGHAVFDAAARQSVHDLLRTADQHMYRNKQAYKRQMRDARAKHASRLERHDLATSVGNDDGVLELRR